MRKSFLLLLCVQLNACLAQEQLSLVDEFNDNIFYFPEGTRDISHERVIHIEGNVTFNNGKPAKWVTRLGYWENALVCVQLHDIHARRRDLVKESRCIYTEDGKYHLPVPTRWFIYPSHSHEVLIQVREDMDQTRKIRAIDGTYNFILPFDEKGLLECHAAAEVCDQKDNNCNGKIDDRLICDIDSDQPNVQQLTCSRVNTRKRYFNPRNEMIRISLRLHILLDDDGWAPLRCENQDPEECPRTDLTMADARLYFEEGLDFLNSSFRKHGMEFTLIDAQFIRDTDTLYIESIDRHENVFSFDHLYGNKEVVDVFLVQKMEGAGGFCHLPTSPLEGIYISWNASIATLAHEVGHFFGLMHTFGLLDGNLCDTAGDGICDTPYDPGPDRCSLEYLERRHCSDENCDEDGNCYAPQNFCNGRSLLMNNIMSYFSPCHPSKEKFSHEQYARMYCSIDQERSYLRMCKYGEDLDGDGVLCENDCNDWDPTTHNDCLSWPSTGCQSDDDCQDVNACTKGVCRQGACMIDVYEMQYEQCGDQPNQLCSDGECKSHSPCDEATECASENMCVLNFCLQKETGAWCVEHSSSQNGRYCGDSSICQFGECTPQ